MLKKNGGLFLTYLGNYVPYVLRHGRKGFIVNDGMYVPLIIFKEFYMKKFLKMLGIIAFVAVIGISVMGCPVVLTSGTVMVYNNSSSSSDNPANSVSLYTSGGTLIRTSTYFYRYDTVTWTGLDTGINYYIKAVDSANRSYTSSTFYLSAGETRSYSYSGTGFSLR